MKLEGKIALVTGGSRGIGRGIALKLAEEGANVVVNYHSNAKAANELVKQIKAMGRDAIAVKANVGKAKEVEAMVKKAVEKFGKIDILANNAGIEPGIGPFTKMKEEDWDAIFDTNIKGVFLCSKAVAPYMIKQKGGRIINTSSCCGKSGWANFAAYSASKWAIIGFTQATAAELAPHKITVNAICPGAVQTDMLDKEVEILARLGEAASAKEMKKNYLSMCPLGRLETPEDLGKVAVFLASDDGFYITGEALNVSGGLEVH